MRKIFLLSVIVFIYARANSQSCSNCSTCENCDKILKIAPYNLKILIPMPHEKGVALAQWDQLFWLSRFANSKLFELNKDCMHFIQPLILNEEGEEVLRVGLRENGITLPENSNPSKYGNYIITGFVSSSGAHYLMHLELQAACSRKKVAAVDIPFVPSSDPKYIHQIGEQAASQLSPLIDKINSFIERERASDNQFARGDGDMIIKPKKEKLAEGEETEIEITLKDCDGYILSNRKINFSKDDNPQFVIPGTTGGSVTPSVITTDANGKARAKFKMGSGKTAVIRAHYVFKGPSGCKKAIFGVHPVNGVPVKVEVEYDMINEVKFDPSAFNLGGAVKFEGGNADTYFTRVYNAVFYYYPSNTPKDMLLLVVPEEKIGTNTVFEKEEGFFYYKKDEEATTAKAYLAGKEVDEESMSDAISEANYRSVKPEHTNIFAFRKQSDTDPMSFDLVFNFTNEGEDHAIGTGSFSNSVSIREGDNGVSITKKKITDPNSPYKTEYIAELNITPEDVVKAADKLLGTDFKGLRDAMNYMETGKEHAKIRMLVPY